MNNKEYVISLLMSNDSNSSWDEVEDVETLIDGLKQAIINNEDDEDIKEFYQDMLELLID